MSVRSGDGVGSSIERLLAGLSGPSLVDDPPPQDFESPRDSPSNSADDDGDAEQNDRYDEDFDYYWAGLRLPLWVALIWQVPWRQRLDIFVIGFMIGMVVAGAALLWGFVLSQY